jgi:hypothetical protein
VNELDIFITWVAYYLHFTKEDYNFIEYNGTVKATAESLIKRPEYKLYVASKLKFKTKREMLEILLSGIDLKRTSSPLFITDALEQKIHHPNVVKRWLRKVSSLQFTFSVDVDNIIESGFSKKELFFPSGGQLPKLIKLWEDGDINTETLKILDIKYNIFKLWDTNLRGNFIWERHKFFINRYCMFINIDDRDYSISFERFRLKILK